MLESIRWREFAEDYDDRIFSLTSFPKRRQQILQRIRTGKVLNLGAGPTPYLNIDLLDNGNTVIASDFCLEMLIEAEMQFMHNDLRYRLEDSRELSFCDEVFDSVVSINSILPPNREDVDKMIKEVFRVLKPGGVFVAFLTAYYSAKSSGFFKLDIELDPDNFRVDDGGGWQCFHTVPSIYKMLEGVNYRGFECKIVYLDTPAEISELQRLYGIDTSNLLCYEYLLRATKKRGAR